MKPKHNKVRKIKGGYYIDKLIKSSSNSNGPKIPDHFYLKRISKFRYFINKILNYENRRQI
jgi:hypothetical protein